MSILVRGMEMPQDCGHCSFRYVTTLGKIICEMTHKEVSTKKFATRPKNCPLSPLPDEHGRLIDADAYIKMMEEKCDHSKSLDEWVLSVCRGGIKTMPTIIDAERGET